MIARLPLAGRVAGLIAAVLRYRLHEALPEHGPLKLLRALRFVLPRPRRDIGQLGRGARLRLMLEEQGPIFVKFGQILSTRRDLLPEDLATELALLQDRVAPFPGQLARERIEAELGRPLAELFADFDPEPLASASIAQVHAARLADGREVVVKVLRPGIHQRVAADTALLRALAELAHRFHPNRDNLRPRQFVAEIEQTLLDELDLQREGASASLLRRNFEGSTELKIPAVYWPLSTERVLTLERVRGLPCSDLDALRAAGVKLERLAERLIELLYVQVFRDNFFHADMHPGNILVDASRPEDPGVVLVDFGIVGQLPPEDQRYLAENFMALFSRDYRRIAELHLESGWIPASVRVDVLEGAVRTVCEPYFTRPLSEISLGEVLLKLFAVAHRFKLIVQPQLILLQKTLLNIEGLSRSLHPRIDIWAVARPVLERIMRENYGLLGSAARELHLKLPPWLAEVPALPKLMHDGLRQLRDGPLVVRLDSGELKALVDANRSGGRRTVTAVLGATLVLVATLSALLAGPEWLAPGAGVVGALAFLAALRRV